MDKSISKKYRYKITLEYDGSNFCGWQQQNGAESVQETIQNAIFKFTGEIVVVFGAGRTDAGVHAMGQVAHFDLHKYYPNDKVCDALNFFLKNYSIAILKTELVDDSFHARFSAISRSYIYKIINRRAPLTIEKNRAWHINEKLDISKMNAAGKILIGKHDFSSFRTAHCQGGSSIRTIDKLEITQNNELIEIEISAKSFLHNQVRIIVGTLRKFGNNTWPIEKMCEILDAKNRSAAGQTASPTGLYFLVVGY